MYVHTRTHARMQTHTHIYIYLFKEQFPINSRLFLLKMQHLMRKTPLFFFQKFDT